MIPLRDTIPSHSFPIVTVSLIALNTLIFLHLWHLGPRIGERFVLHYGFVPVVHAHLASSEPWNLPAVYGPMFSSMFLHGSWLHLIGNMWMLWIFGDNVEDRLGRGRFLLYYLACGLAAVYLHYLTERTSGVPVIGASGAIAGVMGGYFVLFPHARVLTVIPIFIFLHIVTIPAVVFLALWFMLQLLSGIASSGAQLSSGVAWWAHVGGFIAGAVLMFPKRRQLQRRSVFR